MMQDGASPQELIDAMMRETDPTRQSRIIAQLGEQGVVEAVEPLMNEVLRNEYHSGAAIAALGRIGDPRAIGVLIQSFRYQNLGWMAKDALVRIGPQAIEPLIEALRHENPDIRFVAARTLGELRDPRAIEPLQTMIEQDPDDTNRQAARHTLKTLLLDHLNDERADVRLHAVRGLAWLGDARTIEALQRAASHDPDDEMQQAAQAAIVQLVRDVEYDPFAEHELPLRSRETNLLLNRLQRLTGVQIARVDSLADLPGETATIDTLLDVARRPDDATVQMLACDALMALCTDYLRSASADARILAARGLGQLATPEAQHMLAQVAADDPDDAVRRAARAAPSPT